MKIGVISDSHDHVRNILTAISFLNAEGVETIYHCGDWVSPFTFEFFFKECKPQAKVKGVLGNNEGDRFRLIQRIMQKELPLTLEQHVLTDDVGGRKIAVYHGQNKNITLSLIKSGLYDAVFTGHTHQPLIETSGHTLHLNPGTLCDAAFSKIIDTPTLAVYDTQTNQAQIIEFLKGGK